MSEQSSFTVQQLASRLEQLESRSAWQEHGIAELGQQLYQQVQRIDRLESLLEQLAKRLKDINEALPQPAVPHERPPHY